MNTTNYTFLTIGYLIYGWIIIVLCTGLVVSIWIRIAMSYRRRGRVMFFPDRWETDAEKEKMRLADEVAKGIRKGIKSALARPQPENPGVVRLKAGSLYQKLIGQVTLGEARCDEICSPRTWWNRDGK